MKKLIYLIMIIAFASCSEVRVNNNENDPVNVKQIQIAKRGLIRQHIGEKLEFRSLGSDTCDVDINYLGGNGVHLVLEMGGIKDTFVIEVGNQTISIPKGTKALVYQHEKLKYFLTYTSYPKMANGASYR